MNLLPGVRSHTIATDRLRMHYIESGPADGIPVVLIHGNLATGRFYEHLLPGAPDRYRFIAPDMRGFGDTERVPIDATRGLRDWADDTHALVQALGIDRPLHLAGWSTGGAAIAAYAIDRPVASLTFIDPVSPYGFGGVKADGTPCFSDYAGSGGGTGSPDFTQRLAAGDRSTESPFSPRNVMRTSDIVVADGSAWEMGTLGKLGIVPGWPGEDVFPPQPMVTQIRTVLERYREAGGRVKMEMFEGSGHGPAIDAADRWSALFFSFLASVE